jgi:hypothetical protein
MLSSLQEWLGDKNLPIFDMSPRGLFVNWFRRNAKSFAEVGGQKTNLVQIVTSPSYSWDFVRVLQHYRKNFGPFRTPKQAMPVVPAYPFSTENCTKIVKEAIVRSFSETVSTHALNMCHEVVFEVVTDDDDIFDMVGVVGLDLICPGGAFWDALGIHGKAFQDMEKVESTLVQEAKVTLVVMGPLKGCTIPDAFKDPMSGALDFVDVLGKLLVREDSPVDALLFVSEDETHAAFEYIVGFFAAMRHEVSNLRFVSTLRLHTTLPDSAIKTIDAGMAKRVLAMAKRGETVMRLTTENSAFHRLSSQRIVPLSRPLTFSADWVKSDCLYVVSGASGALAKSLLPFLAACGVRHFLLLVNRRKPDASMIQHMFRALGATTIHIESCNITEEESIQAAVRNGLIAARAQRVAGVFHLAAIDIPQSARAVSKLDLSKILQVKFTGHQTLMKSIQLQKGDIFSVPGSITTYIGGGIGYAATNCSCRALQLQASNSGLLAPYPALGISELSMDTNLFMPNVKKEDRNVFFQLKGVAPCATQLFNLGMTGSLCTRNEIILCRTDAEAMHRFLNSVSPSLVCAKLIQTHREQRCPFFAPVAIIPAPSIITPGLVLPRTWNCRSAVMIERLLLYLLYTYIYTIVYVSM